jgi:hypothetical protein
MRLQSPRLECVIISMKSPISFVADKERAFPSSSRATASTPFSRNYNKSSDAQGFGGLGWVFLGRRPLPCLDAGDLSRKCALASKLCHIRSL